VCGLAAEDTAFGTKCVRKCVKIVTGQNALNADENLRVSRPARNVFRLVTRIMHAQLCANKTLKSCSESCLAVKHTKALDGTKALDVTKALDGTKALDVTKTLDGTKALDGTKGQLHGQITLP